MATRSAELMFRGGRFLLGCGCAAVLLAGCARVPVAQQGRVSKLNMVFADTVIFGDRSGLQGQIEPGAPGENQRNQTDDHVLRIHHILMS